MYKILLADLSPYRDTLKNIFTENGYDAIFCDSAFDAISKLKAYDFDLVVSEVELPGDNAFDLYEYIEGNYPDVPMIMVTDKNIDRFFNRIFEQGIGNVLHKPVNPKEILNLTEKLITKKRIFGLNNYLSGIKEIKRMKVKKSLQINRAIDLIIEQISGWNFRIPNRATLGLMLNEMVINAVYHSHGLTQEKLERIPVELPEDKFVDIQFCCNDDSFAISITDSNGKLSKAKILESINNVIKQNMLIEKSLESGEDISDFISESGRGLDLVRKLSGEYYFIIKKDCRTEIIFIFKNTDKPFESDTSSLKIIEDRS
jgi:CheY-like chemotaxis protein/two-component sensor histidine kinase